MLERLVLWPPVSTVHVNVVGSGMLSDSGHVSGTCSRRDWAGAFEGEVMSASIRKTVAPGLALFLSGSSCHKRILMTEKSHFHVTSFFCPTSHTASIPGVSCGFMKLIVGGWSAVGRQSGVEASSDLAYLLLVLQHLLSRQLDRARAKEQRHGDCEVFSR